MNNILDKNISSKTQQFILAGLILLSLCLNFYNIDFSLGYHSDEPKKIKYLLESFQDFHHPILMLQCARVLKKLIPFDGVDQLVILGRSVSAMSGVIAVMAMFYLARTKFNRYYSTLIAFAVASSPIIVTHAHYLKEDMIFLACAMISLLCFFYYMKAESLFASFILGISLGLSISAQYKGFLIIFLFLVAPIFLPRLRKPGYYKHLLLWVMLVAVIFAIVNYPIFRNPSVFLNGIGYESNHILTGHTLRIYPLAHFFSFHLMNSILPGILLPLTCLSLAGLGLCIISWKEETDCHKLLFLYCILFYFVHEVSPSKPSPDFGRYMIPIAPILIYFSFSTLQSVFHWIQKSINNRTVFGNTIIAGLLLIVLMPPLYSSIKFIYHFKEDTRKQALKWINKSGEKAIFEHLTTDVPDYDVYSLSSLDIEEVRKNGVSYLVAGSFVYERYIKGSKLKNQEERIYTTYQKYKELFSFPYLEIKPTYKSYGFSNPTIRIIDIREGDDFVLRKEI